MKDLKLFILITISSFCYASNQLSLGLDFACAIEDGEVKCWGKNKYNHLNVPFLTNPSKVVSSSSGTCAQEENDLLCWGYNEDMKIPKFNNLQSYSISMKHGCAIDDWDLVCWGDDEYGVLKTPYFDDPHLVVTNREYACAANEEEIKCWGSFNGTKNNLVEGIKVKNPRYMALTTMGLCFADDNGVTCRSHYTYKEQQYPEFKKVSSLAVTPNSICLINDSHLFCDSLFGYTMEKDLKKLLKKDNPLEIASFGYDLCAQYAEEVSCIGSAALRYKYHLRTGYNEVANFSEVDNLILELSKNVSNVESDFLETLVEYRPLGESNFKMKVLEQYLLSGEKRRIDSQAFHKLQNLVSEMRRRNIHKEKFEKSQKTQSDIIATLLMSFLVVEKHVDIRSSREIAEVSNLFRNILSNGVMLSDLVYLQANLTGIMDIAQKNARSVKMKSLGRIQVELLKYIRGL